MKSVNDKIEIDEQFRAALLGEDDLGKIIRSHIYVERQVNQLIYLSIHYPKLVEEARLSYNQRIHIAASLGVMRRNLLPPLRKLGELRNRFAHNPVAKIAREVETQYLNSFSKRDTDVMTKSYLRTLKKIPSSKPTNFRKLETPDRFVLATTVLFGALIHCRLELLKAGPGMVFNE